MRNFVFGAIGIVWGIGIVVYGLTGDGGGGTDAYVAGQRFAMVLGAVMAVAGVMAVRRELRIRNGSATTD